MPNLDVREWLIFLGLMGGAVAGVQQTWVRAALPFLRGTIRAKRGFDRIVAYVEREIANGDDPPEFKGKSTRSALIEHHQSTKPIIASHHRLEQDVKNHLANHP